MSELIRKMVQQNWTTSVFMQININRIGESKTVYSDLFNGSCPRAIYKC